MIFSIKDIAFGIWGAVTLLVDGMSDINEYFINLVRDIAWITSYVLYLSQDAFKSWFQWLPDTCISVVVSCIGIAIVYKLLGRE